MGLSHAMKRILVAWELGLNFGHLSRDAPLMQRCLNEGCAVFLAARDLKSAATVIGDLPVTTLQAPRMPRVEQAEAINFADLLLKAGFGQPGRLAAIVDGWLSLFNLMKPAALVYDYAPGALLAARIAGLPVLMCGTGFEIPPEQSPLPSIRPWEGVTEAALLMADRNLTSIINSVLATHRRPLLEKVTDLFAGHEILLAAYPELDPFGPRPDAVYLGTLAALPGASNAHWSHSGGPRILCYLRVSLIGLETALTVLQALPAEVLCVIPDIPQDWRARYPALRLHDRPLDFPSLLAAADLVVTSGGTTVSEALRTGVPVMLLPEVGEQYMTGLALERLSAGRMMATIEEPAFSATLQSLLTEPRFKQAALAFADRHRSVTRGQAVEQQWQALARIAGL